MQFTRFPNQLGKQTFFSPPSSPIYIFHLQALQILSSLYLDTRQDSFLQISVNFVMKVNMRILNHTTLRWTTLRWKYLVMLIE
jgi:hypothetical protein